jgi:hypothetical protein
MDLAPLIAARLTSGVLPKQLPTKRWTGYGGSQKCAGCDLPIYAHEIEDEFDCADGRRIRLHRACAHEWMRQALNGDAPPSPLPLTPAEGVATLSATILTRARREPA